MGAAQCRWLEQHRAGRARIAVDIVRCDDLRSLDTRRASGHIGFPAGKAPQLPAEHPTESHPAPTTTGVLSPCLAENPHGSYSKIK